MRRAQTAPRPRAQVKATSKGVSSRRRLGAPLYTMKNTDRISQDVVVSLWGVSNARFEMANGRRTSMNSTKFFLRLRLQLFVHLQPRWHLCYDISGKGSFAGWISHNPHLNIPT